MRVYLTRLIGTGRDDNPFRIDAPAGATHTSIIDLRPDPTSAAGWVIATCDLPLPPPALELSDDVHKRNIAARAIIQAQLGIAVMEGTVAEMIAELLILHGTGPENGRWKRLRASGKRYEIFLGGERIWSMPVVSGGASITETFDIPDTIVLGGDLTWTEVTGNWNIVSNKARLLESQGLTFCEARAEHDLATSDHYALADVLHTATPSLSGNAGVCVRFSDSVRTFYSGQGSNAENIVRLHKMVNGNATLLATTQRNIGVATLYTRVRAVGSSIQVIVHDTAISITDTSITTGTRCGLIGQSSTTGQVDYDNFHAADIAVEQPFARSLHYVEDPNDASTVSTTYVERLSLTFTPDPLGVYLFYYYGEVAVAGTTSNSAYVQGSDGGEQPFESYVVGTGQRNLFGFLYLHTASVAPPALTKRIQYRAENSSNAAHLRRPKIMAFKLGEEDHYSNNREQQSETSTTIWKDLITLAFTPATQGDYLIIAGARHWASAIGTDMNFRILGPGDIAYGSTTRRPKDTTDRLWWGTMVKLNLAASAQSFKVQMKSGTTGTTNADDVMLIALRLDKFLAHGYAEARSRNTLTNATARQDKVTLTDTLSAGKHLALSAILGDPSVQDLVGTFLTWDSIVEDINAPASTVVANNRMPLLGFNVIDVAAGRSETMRVGAWAGASATTLGMQEAAVGYLRLDGGATPASDVPLPTTRRGSLRSMIVR